MSRDRLLKARRAWRKIRARLSPESRRGRQVKDRVHHCMRRIDADIRTPKQLRADVFRECTHELSRGSLLSTEVRKADIGRDGTKWHADNGQTDAPV